MVSMPMHAGVAESLQHGASTVLQSIGNNAEYITASVAVGTVFAMVVIGGAMYFIMLTKKPANELRKEGLTLLAISAAFVSLASVGTYALAKSCGYIGSRI